MVDGIFTKSRMLTLAILAVVPTGTGLQPRYVISSSHQTTLYSARKRRSGCGQAVSHQTLESALGKLVRGLDCCTLRAAKPSGFKMYIVV